MKKINKNSIVTASAVLVVLGLIGPIAAFAAGPAPVDLLSVSANNFVILAKTQITDATLSTITGNIGLSPAAGTFVFVTCPEMTGTIYTVDATYVGSGNVTCVAPGPGANKTLVDNAILDMGTAYGDAAGRTLPDFTELYTGDLSGRTLTPGLYKWSTDVVINTDVTLSGGANDVWIFQISGDLNIASGGSVPAGIKVILAGGAKASNVFWQVGASNFGATLGTYSTFNGNILSAKQVIIQTGAVLNGRALADSQVTLDANAVSLPVAPSPVLTTITVSPTSTSLAIGATQQLTVTSLDQFGASIAATINYTTSDSSVATVNGTGLVTAVASGSATVTASSSAISATSAITVEVPAPTPAPVTPVSPCGGGGCGAGGSGGGGGGYYNFSEPSANLPSNTGPGSGAGAPQGQVLGAVTFRFTSTLQVGSRGDDVTQLQRRLAAEGAYSGSITGYFGQLTFGAVKKYQENHGITAVGIVGPITRAKLNSSLAIAPATGQVLGASSNADDEATKVRITALQFQLLTLLQRLASMLQT